MLKYEIVIHNRKKKRIKSNFFLLVHSNAWRCTDRC